MLSLKCKVVVLTAMILLLPVLAGYAKEETKEILIGTAVSLSGKESVAGTSARNAYELAIKEVNDRGGIEIRELGLKLPVRLVVYDDESSPEKSAGLIERLITEDEVDVLLGGMTTPIVEPQTEVAEEYRVPFISGSGAASHIYNKGYRWIFTTCSSIESGAATLMDFIREQQEKDKLPKPLKIAMVWEDSSHGLDFQNGVHRQVERFPGNFEIVLDKSFAWMSTDFVPLLNKVKKTKADVFLSDAHLTDFVLMHHQYTQLGLSHLLVSYGARGSEEIAREELGSAVDYLVSIAWWSKDLPYPQVRKFINNYQTAYGSSPEWYAGTPYEAVRALLRAIEKAGSLDRAKIRDALAGLDMMNSTVAGQHLFFKKNGQANYPLLIIQNRPDGTVPIVHPADAAAAKATVPRPRVRFKVAVLHLGPIDDYGWTYQAHLGAQEMAEELPYVELSEEGCDVIANHSDSYAPAVAADERGVYYISLNSNLRRFAPHVFLAGAVWNWAPIMTDIVRIVREGTWDKHPGQDWWYGLAEEGVKLAPFSDLVPEDVRKMVEEKKQAIIQGEFQVFPGMSDKQLREIYHFESNVVGKLP